MEIRDMLESCPQSAKSPTEKQIGNTLGSGPCSDHISGMRSRVSIAGSKCPTNLVCIFTWLFGLVSILSARPPEDLRLKLEAFVKEQAGGVAVVWVDADGVFYETAGNYSAEDTRPITPETRFEIGSVTKGFNALLLAESVRLGRVTLDDPAANHLLPSEDTLRPALAKITLRSLVTHTSGLPRLPHNLGSNP